MSLLVERIPNSPIDSNSFVIYTEESNSCIIIDPGTEDCADLIEFINCKNLIPQYIFLTHEHFDHIWGVNKLKEMFNPLLVSSSNCASKIVDKKKNMSVFYNQLGFETYPADHLVDEINNKLIWNNYKIIFYNTPGHTEGSICILIEQNLFTGDTLIKDEKTVTKLPGGNKDKLVLSYTLLYKIFATMNPIVHAGHGHSFPFCESKLSRFKNNESS
jgi:glyoxylase-like metal-dependent hydrolase (beta-lactamase superfamily II)